MTLAPSTLVVGPGFLGRRFASSIDGACLSDVDIANRADVGAALDARRPTAVINCAGKTGRPNVDWCESHQDETYRSNVVGPLILADECRKRGIYLLHLGSGCIFYGPSPSPGGWCEDDFANPVSFYSATKYAADIVLSRLPGVGIARLRMPVDAEPGARNLVTKLASYQEVIDVENSVTVVDDLVVAVVGLLAVRAEGIFHVTNPGTLLHRTLLSLYRKHVDPTHRAHFIAEHELVEKGLALKVRSNCILANHRLAALGISLRHVDVALPEVLERYARQVRLGEPAGAARPLAI